MKKLMISSLFALVSLSAFAAPAIECKKAVLYVDQVDGSLKQKPYNLKFVIQKNLDNKLIATIDLKGERTVSLDIYKQSLSKSKVAAMAEYTEQMTGFNPYKGIVTAETFDIGPDNVLGVVVGLDAKKNISRILFTTADGMGECK